MPNIKPMDIDDYERTRSTISLLTALAEGEQSASVHGCMSIEEVERNLGLSQQIYTRKIPLEHL